MSFTPFGQVLQMQGGSLQQKCGTFFAENLKVTKSVDGGGLGSLQSGILSGGMSSITMNPIAAIMTQVQATVAGFISQTSGSPSPYPMTNAALTSMSTTLGTFGSVATNMLTEAPASGFYGFGDLMLHQNTESELGEPPPAQYSTATAMAPLTSAPLLGVVNSGVTNAVNALLVSGGTATDTGTAALIGGLTSSMQSVLASSNSAISGLRSALTAVACAKGVGGAIAAARPAAFPTASATRFNALLQQIIQPDAYASLQAAGIAQISTPAPVIVDTPQWTLISRTGNLISRAIASVQAAFTNDIEVI